LVVGIYVPENMHWFKKAIIRLKMDVFGPLELDGHFVPRDTALNMKVDADFVNSRSTSEEL